MQIDGTLNKLTTVCAISDVFFCNSIIYVNLKSAPAMCLVSKK
jgi:hypothetical protein